MAEIVACKDVAKEMRLEVVVGLRCEPIVERLSGELGLHPGAASQRVIIGRQRRCLASRFARLSILLALLNDLLQSSQGIERARESCVGVELRKSLFDLADGESGVKAVVDSDTQAGDVATRFVGGNGHERLLCSSKFHSFCCPRCGCRKQCHGSQGAFDSIHVLRLLVCVRQTGELCLRGYFSFLPSWNASPTFSPTTR